MNDKEGNELKNGDVCFYTERPYSNYADSLVEIYEEKGQLMVGSLVINDLSGKKYKMHERDELNDLPLEIYTWDIHHKPTGKAENLQLINGISPSEADIDFANERFPLDI